MTERPSRGLLFNIQRGSLHDGPGIRTVLFFKGCPLNCIWCQNPESQSRGIEYMAATAPDGQDLRVKIGDYYKPGQALAEIEKDLAFFIETGGGVTFSGGEPTLQPRFLRDLVHGCKTRNIHTTLETCGYFHYDSLIGTLLDIDLIYFDIKIIDAERHKHFTGKANRRILANLKKLHKEHPNVHLRYVSVPGQNCEREHLAQLADFLHKLNIRTISILKYNPLWSGKTKKLGRPEPKIKQYALGRIESCWKNAIDFMQTRGFQVVTKA